jgi:hypothetical protein
MDAEENFCQNVTLIMRPLRTLVSEVVDEVFTFLPR